MAYVAFSVESVSLCLYCIMVWQAALGTRTHGYTRLANKTDQFFRNGTILFVFHGHYLLTLCEINVTSKSPRFGKLW